MKHSENLNADKRLALNRLIANGFIEQANGRSITNYQHTAKTELLFTQLCVGISGGYLPATALLTASLIC